MPLSATQESTLFTGVGASTVPAILGEVPTRTPYQVWLEYTYPAEREARKPTLAMRLGDLIEPLAIELAGDYWGITPLPPDPAHTYSLASHPWAQSHPDALVKGETAGIEAKVRSIRMRHAYEEAEGEPLLSELMQCTWQMLTANWSHVYLAVLLGNEEMRHWRIERSEANCEYLLNKVGNWYRTYILGGVPPPPVTADDIRHRWPRSAKGKVVEIHAEVASAVLEYQAVGEEIRKQERRREELFTQIAAAAQDAECLTLAGRQVATFKEHTRTSVDLNRMREQVPLVVQEYETERRYRVLRASRR